MANNASTYGPVSKFIALLLVIPEFPRLSGNTLVSHSPDEVILKDGAWDPRCF